MIRTVLTVYAGRMLRNMWYLESKIGLKQVKLVENHGFVKIFNLVSVAFKKITTPMVNSIGISVHIACQQVNS